MFTDFYTAVVVVVVVVVVLTLLSTMTRRPPGIPPGPPLLPLFGNALSMSLDTRATFRRLRRRYGDIFSVYAFNHPVIALNGFDVLKDAFAKNADVFSDRPHSFLSDHLLRGRGIVGTSGIIWQEQRKFAVNTLREFGVGKALLEDKIHDEIGKFLYAMDRHKGVPFNCKPIIGSAVANIICSVILGKRFEYEDEHFIEILRRMDENIANFGAASILNVFPIVRHLPWDFFGFKKILNNLDFTETTFVRPCVKEHIENDGQEHDFISAYIKEMRYRQQQKVDTSMNTDNLETVILDIFGTGSETIATTICWTLVYFLNYPDVQEKCFQEVKATIGLDRPPSMKDKKNLPYLEATISETLRFANITPAGVPHTVSRDIWFRGYKIPKGVMVLPVLDSVLHDPKIWGDPEKFRPERFLDEKRNYRKREEFIPFSLGRRTCLGEALSYMELFLFLASMLQRFRFTRDKGDNPSLEPQVGIIHSPKPFRVKTVPR